MLGPLLIVPLALLVLHRRRELVLVLIEHRHTVLRLVRVVTLRSIGALLSDCG